MRASECDGDLGAFMQRYHYQEELTARLDSIGDYPFDQALVNEIVLWKVNRYAQPGVDLLGRLNTLSNLYSGEHWNAETVLRELLDQHGIDLPMASTLLRFRNPAVFQIIDRHTYRALKGVKYPLYPTSNVEQKIQVYFHYLDALLALSAARGVRFRDLDRILYIFDKDNNGLL